MEMDPNGLTQLDDEMESQEDEEHQQEHITEHQAQQQQQQQQHHHHQQQPQQQQLQQISVDQISAEKLTLTDLLQFKPARPRDEIILQIHQKHPTDGECCFIHSAFMQNGRRKHF